MILQDLGLDPSRPDFGLDGQRDNGWRARRPLLLRGLLLATFLTASLMATRDAPLSSAPALSPERAVTSLRL